jgi:CheY-like chemotaxis protein
VLAADGEQAIAAVSREPFDLILMDVQMPGMNGFEATTAIRALEQGTGRRTPIAAITAHALSGDRERCLEAGMDAYISKPVRAYELYAAVETLARRRPAPAAAMPTPATAAALVAAPATPTNPATGPATTAPSSVEVPVTAR